MAGQFTMIGATYALDHVINDPAGTAVRYLALGTALPADATSPADNDYQALEIITAGYSRQSVSWGAVTATGGTVPTVIANDAQIVFGPFTADPPEVGYCWLSAKENHVDSEQNIMAVWTVATARDASTGDSLLIDVGALTLSIY